MKRQSGAWIAIICILVVGISVTKITSDFVASGITGAEEASTAAAVFGAAADPSSAGAAAVPETGAGAPAQRAAAEGAPPADLSGQGESGALDGQTPELSRMAAVPAGENPDSPALSEAGEQASAPALADAETAAVPEQARQETVKSPLEPGPANRAGLSASAGVVENLDAAGFVGRLDSIAGQIAQSKGNQEDSTAAALYMAAQHEWNLWDNELNQIYAAVRSRLSGKEADDLRQSELEWIKERDMAADRAAGKASGQTAQSAPYAEAAARKTKERCYEMVEKYRELLDDTAGKLSSEK